MTQVGDIVERDDKRWLVTHVQPNLTPYRKRNQDTRIEGYTLGLKELEPVRSVLVRRHSGPCSCEEPDFPPVPGRDLSVTSKANVVCFKCGHRRWG